MFGRPLNTALCSLTRLLYAYIYLIYIYIYTQCKYKLLLKNYHFIKTDVKYVRKIIRLMYFVCVK